MEKKLPGAYKRFAAEQPRIASAYEALSEACLAEGPLDRKTIELVKIGIALGAHLEGGMHSHVRRALEAGATADDIRHAVRQGLTTVGFPTMMRALAWVEDVLQPGGRERTR